MLTSKSSLSYVLCCNLVNISRRMESKVSFGIKILWAIRWLWKVPLYVLQKLRKWQKESGPSDMGHPVNRIEWIIRLKPKNTLHPLIHLLLFHVNSLECADQPVVLGAAFCKLLQLLAVLLVGFTLLAGDAGVALRTLRIHHLEPAQGHHKHGNEEQHVPHDCQTADCGQTVLG